MLFLFSASRYVVVHVDDQKIEDNKRYFVNLGRSFRDVEDNRTFKITSVVKKGQEKKLYYRYYDVMEHPSGPPRISPFYDNVEEDPFEYTHCSEITNSACTYVQWLDSENIPCSSSSSQQSVTARKRKK